MTRVTMPWVTAMIDADRAKIATQLIDLETAERVLARVSKTPPARRPRSASAAEAKASNATRGRGRPPSKSAGGEPSARSLGLGERVLALATGKTRRELYAACPGDRPAPANALGDPSWIIDFPRRAARQCVLSVTTSTTRPARNDFAMILDELS
jgi:hypothetical protein